MANPTPMRTPEEIAKEIVKRFRENERVHTEEWDESRYLEKKIASAIRTERKEVETLKSALKEAEAYLTGLLHQNHHTIEEERFRIEAALSKIREIVKP